MNHEIITGIFLVCGSAVFGFIIGVCKLDVKFYNYLNGVFRK